jgi:K+-transporting ATPase KdpF subunit
MCLAASSRLRRAPVTFVYAAFCEGRVMVLDYALGGIVTVFLLVYLVFALVRPEKF